MRSVVVVNSLKDWLPEVQDVEVVTARVYLTEPGFAEMRAARIVNLCRSYRYQSIGYYVSLLAEARGHRPVPNVATIQDLKSQTISRVISEEIDETIQKTLNGRAEPAFDLPIYFGRGFGGDEIRSMDRLAAGLSNLFQSPLLRASFLRGKDRWQLRDISPIPITEVPDIHRAFIAEAARGYFARKRLASPRISSSQFDLAILVDPEESGPPSDKKAIRLFQEQADELGIRPQLIGRDDASRISEFDGLFIRATTSVNHYTYRLARRAFAEGLVVIDDPRSILQCANKVYLAEALSRAKVPTPKTVIVHRENQDELEARLGLPCVLKKPDGSFSRGVVKVETPAALREEVARMLESSDLIIAQAFVPTPFDWRIGVLDREPLFACRYYMADGHWQIFNWKAPAKDDRMGRFETVPIYQTPKSVLKTAVRAANLVGDGLYGVDVKQVGTETLVIEVNDNPNIDGGVEDQVMGELLYRTIMRSFKDRMEDARRKERIPL